MIENEKMVVVKSSNIKSVGHDGKNMRIDFFAGTSYLYHDVPVGLHEAFMKAESVEAFFASMIRGKYTTDRILPNPQKTEARS